MIEDLLSLVKKHEQWRGNECLNLIPSENITSPTVRQLLSSDLGHRYTAKDQFYMGTRLIDEIEEYGEKIAREVFNAETADLRPLSGHIADLIFLASFTGPNDTIMCISPKDGGYPGLWTNGLPDFLKLKTLPMPFERQHMNINVQQAKEAISSLKPKLIIFGASLITFPHPVKDLAEVAQENNALIGFDGSHVIGLIGGRKFQDPLREGSDALFGSTHKTMFGPQGGIILAKKEFGKKIKEAIFPTFVDNAHWNRIAALAVTLAELKTFGRSYADQVVRNAKTLAKTLHQHGFPVACPHLGFTESHQVLLDFGDETRNRSTAERLQKVNIIVDRGIRLGTCEVTRRGMKETEMQEIAELIHRTVNKKEDPEKIKNEVVKYSQEFLKVGYCFDD